MFSGAGARGRPILGAIGIGVGVVDVMVVVVVEVDDDGAAVADELVVDFRFRDRGFGGFLFGVAILLFDDMNPSIDFDEFNCGDKSL